MRVVKAISNIGIIYAPFKILKTKEFFRKTFQPVMDKIFVTNSFTESTFSLEKQSSPNSHLEFPPKFELTNYHKTLNRKFERGIQKFLSYTLQKPGTEEHKFTQFAKYTNICTILCLGSQLIIYILYCSRAVIVALKSIAHAVIPSHWLTLLKNVISTDPQDQQTLEP